MVENILSSYESRIQNMGVIIDTTCQLLEGFQDSFIETKQERDKINTQIRDILARNEHLRRKDFDNMMRGILLTEEEKESEVRGSLKNYLSEHKKMSQVLREDLKRFRDSLAKGEVQRVIEFQEMIKVILVKQEERKEEVISRLKEFEKGQQETAKRLKELLSKGRELRIADLKSMLKEFKAQHQERIDCQEERRERILGILGDFKNRQIQNKTDQGQNNSSEEIK